MHYTKDYFTVECYQNEGTLSALCSLPYYIIYNHLDTNLLHQNVFYTCVEVVKLYYK